VTSPPQPAPGEAKSAGQFLRPLRDLAAYALVGATAVWLFVALIRLIPDGTNGYSYRTQDSFYNFVNVATVFFPLAAVLLALMVQPRHPKAQIVVLAAVVEYAVMGFFGVFFGVLIGVINHASNNGARVAFEELLVRVAWLAVLGVAGFAVFQIWRGLFQVAKPAPQPGVYGQPPQFQPGAYPAGQPGYGPQPGQPGFPPPGPPYPPQQPGAGYVPPGGPGVYGQPPQNPGWNQPAMTVPGVPPTSAPPHSVPPQSAPPSGPYPPQFSGAADPTQVVPPHDAAIDRTTQMPDDRPGFGPADHDPPRH
jgi:hypothetical protein